MAPQAVTVLLPSRAVSVPGEADGEALWAWPQSAYVPDTKERRKRLPLPTAERALAATFRLAEHLHAGGHAAAAVPFFKRAQALQPESWCFKRQAWALTDADQFYGTNFQTEVRALRGRPYYTPLDLGG